MYLYYGKENWDAKEEAASRSNTGSGKKKGKGKGKGKGGKMKGKGGGKKGKGGQGKKGKGGQGKKTNKLVEVRNSLFFFLQYSIHKCMLYPFATNIGSNVFWRF